MAGKISDREVSRRFGVGASTVRRYRLNNDIPSCEVSEAPKELFESLGSMTNYRLSKSFHVSMERIAGLRFEAGVPEPKVERVNFQPLEPDFWTEEALALLGTMPDPDLADYLGVSRFPIKQKRKELGIAPYSKAYPEITAEIAADFGVFSDSVIAKRLGVSTSFVQRARMKWLKREDD